MSTCASTTWPPECPQLNPDTGPIPYAFFLAAWAAMQYLYLYGLEGAFYGALLYAYDRWFPFEDVNDGQRIGQRISQRQSFFKWLWEQVDGSLVSANTLSRFPDSCFTETDFRDFFLANGCVCQRQPRYCECRRQRNESRLYLFDDEARLLPIWQQLAGATNGLVVSPPSGGIPIHVSNHMRDVLEAEALATLGPHVEQPLDLQLFLQLYAKVEELEKFWRHSGPRGRSPTDLHQYRGFATAHGELFLLQDYDAVVAEAAAGQS